MQVVGMAPPRALWRRPCPRPSSPPAVVPPPAGDDLECRSWSSWRQPGLKSRGVSRLRVAFFGTYANTRYPYAGELAHCDGMPRAAGTGLANVLELYDETGNKGNMIHGEAPGRIIACDRSRSAYVTVKGMVEHGWDAGRISDALSRNFDLVVYSTANALRPGVDPGCTAEVLNQLTCGFVVLGMGIQNPLPETTDGLHPNLLQLLDVCSRKARVFGVRGSDTERWLHARGYTGATALGCPSLFVYPFNLLGLQAPDPAALRDTMTAGYIYGQVPRAMALLKSFEGERVHYVVQEEVALLTDQGLLDERADFYDDATAEVNREVFDAILSRIHARKVSFASYRWFQDPNAWRMFASGCDAFIGDRLHGGVASMQAGTPALLIAEDLRVRELVDFFGIPGLTVAEMAGLRLRDLVANFLTAQHLERFKGIYSTRAVAFAKCFRELGIPITFALEAPQQQTTQGSIPPVPGSRFRRLLTRLRHV
jgi:hypothetical protein